MTTRIGWIMGAAAFLAACELATNFDRSLIPSDAAGDGVNDAALAGDAAMPSQDAGADAIPDATIGPPPPGHVFTTQVAYIKPSNTTPGVATGFGGSVPLLGRGGGESLSVALSADGSTLAVGAIGESSASVGVNGDQTQLLDGGKASDSSGAVYVFVRDPAGTWTQQAYLKASDATSKAAFGAGVRLSADGNTLAVRAGVEAGKVFEGYVFERAGASWSQTLIVPAANLTVALSADGKTLVTDSASYTRSSTGWSSSANPSDCCSALSSALSPDGRLLASSPAHYPAGTLVPGFSTFTRQSGSWLQQYGITLGDAGQNYFASLALAGSGSTIAVGESGLNGCTDVCTSGPTEGRAHVFRRANGAWTEAISFSDPVPVLDPRSCCVNNFSDAFGANVALTDSANAMVVSASFDVGCGTGLSDGGGSVVPPDAAAACGYAGAAYAFALGADGAWTRAYIKASNTRADAQFGSSVAISGDGSTLAVGALGESSGAKGINGDQNDTSAKDTGAVYVFR